uniref:Uncharacterized protein n=1 Tax=Oryza brachyantha TaxID=4533 RepID=J3LHS9_ORYBR
MECLNLQGELFCSRRFSFLGPLDREAAGVTLTDYEGGVTETTAGADRPADRRDTWLGSGSRPAALLDFMVSWELHVGIGYGGNGQKFYV